MEAKKQKRKRGVLFAGSFLLFCVVAGLVLLFWFEYRVQQVPPDNVQDAVITGLFQEDYEPLLQFLLEYRMHHIPSDKIRDEDIASLSRGDYETVLLSMYTPEAFDAGDFEYYRGNSTVQAFHTFVNLADISDYLEQSFSCNINLTNVYIGLDPFAVSGLYEHQTSLYVEDYASYLTKYVEAHDDVIFELLVPAYSIEYLQTLSDSKYAELINAYRNLVNIYNPYDNVHIYFLGHEEWLIANSGNYAGFTSFMPSVLRLIVAYTMRDDRYILTLDNIEERFERMGELVRETNLSYPDLSEWCMVFFGDSILTYNLGSMSIPGVVENLSGAQVYNCGEGGLPASGDPAEFFNLNGVINHFFTQDIPEESNGNFWRGLTDYMEEDHEGKKLCFILNVGLNDFFNGFPVENPEDAYDTETYAGALRTGIRSLKEVYPDALILVMAPTYVISAMDINSEVGGVLTDYVDAAVRVAEEMGVYCMNNYYDSGIDAESHSDYLMDGTHLNETGALYLGRQIVEYLDYIMSEKR